MKLIEGLREIEIKSSEVLKVAHQGIWKVSESVSIDCYVTSNKKRLLSLNGTARALGLVGGGSRALPRNLQSKWIEPYLSDRLKEWKNRALEGKIERLEVISGPAIVPFEASLFVDVCTAYMEAAENNDLPKRNTETVWRLSRIISALAKVGIDALVDEITGYQQERERDELQEVLKKYINEEFLEWTKCFPTNSIKRCFD